MNFRKYHIYECHQEKAWIKFNSSLCNSYFEETTKIMGRITRSLKLDANWETIHRLQEHAGYLKREKNRIAREFHIRLDQEIRRTELLEEQLKRKEISVIEAQNELRNLQTEVKRLKEIIEQQKEKIKQQKEKIDHLEKNGIKQEEDSHEFCNLRIGRLTDRVKYFEDREKQREQGEVLPPYLPRCNAQYF